jgi:predicted secreted Zn-dependent protease
VGDERASGLRDRPGAVTGTRDRGVPGRDGGAPSPESGFDPATAATFLCGADAGTRERFATALQRSCGNAAVQRLLAPSPSLPVQRWAVGLKADETNCLTVASYIDKNTPYRAENPKSPGWAKTKATFDWSGTPTYATSGKTTTATVTAPSITKSVKVDMPEWSPTDTVMKRAWTKAMGELRAHETTHEDVATTWESTLKTNLTGLQVTVADRTDPALKKAVGPKWDGWIKQHQADQTALDPFGVTVDCLAAEEAEGESASAAEPGEAGTGESTGGGEEAEAPA